MNYGIGCNYWGSKHGTDMWKYWDEQSVRDDLKTLSKYGVDTLRVFPNWRDFQPIYTLYNWANHVLEYRFKDDKPLDNEFGIDMECIEHFKTFCRIAEENDIKLIVAIVTGWMSGRVFAPPALEGKNHLTDPESLMWQTRFIKGFVSMLKDEKAIQSWELGNETNNISLCDNKNAAYMWTVTVRNAIMAEDNSRAVMSGMHNLGVYPQKDVWTIQDQGEICDVVCPHPYPSPTVGGDVEPMNRVRTTLIPAAQLALYSGIGGKPACIEETGSFNDIVGNQETRAAFLRVNMFSGWANGAINYLWWCAHDQEKLENPPYCWSMNENELGLLYSDYSPKLVALEMKRIADALKNLPCADLPKAEIDVVCVLPDNLEKYHHTASAAFVLAKQAGLNMTFVYFKQKIPKAKLYIVPSAMGWTPIDQTSYKAILAEVKNGATLLVTTGNGFYTDIEKVFGLESLGMKNDNTVCEMKFKGGIPFSYDRKFMLRSVGAEVICEDSDGTVIFSKNKFGDGDAYFLNCPLETQVWYKIDSFINYPYYEIYKTAGKKILEGKPVISNNPDICITIHGNYIVAINYSDKKLKFDYTLNNCIIKNVFYGELNEIPSCDAVIFEIEK